MTQLIARLESPTPPPPAPDMLEPGGMAPLPAGHARRPRAAVDDRPLERRRPRRLRWLLGLLVATGAIWALMLLSRA
jgi:hypothetical protein